ncbi:unnamed protein product [Somion occarium]|uniref:Aminoglycoside phosphotransferase domain-containing protein n=1 Tax=Somion occarium TaxID=3059160 RepID=A0ABP1DPZ8_9APHY
MASTIRLSRTVEWESTLWGSRPRWTSEPSFTDIEHTTRQYLNLPTDAPFNVTFFAEGGFNKLYSIEVPEHEYLIRVALPVDPGKKTISEVATLKFVREQCGIDLVPQVVAYDADAVSPNNFLGFEWMIMEKLPGGVLESKWQDMEWEAKQVLVKTIVGFLAKLYDHPFLGIGNVYPGECSPDKDTTERLVIGPIVSMVFFWDKHYDQDVPRGPFKSSYGWLAARLTFILNDAAETLRTSDDEDDIEEAEESQKLAERLIRLLPSLFTQDVEAPERTIIHHDDISFHNVLVDDSGQLTGLVDWECVSALPLWKACQFPSFLIGPSRKERPDQTSYAVEEDGQPNELYFEHLREWEKTQLRALFIEEMERVRPEWVNEHHAADSKRKADLEFAIQYCDDELSRRKVKKWVDYMESGEKEQSEYLSLQTMLFG